MTILLYMWSHHRAHQQKSQHQPKSQQRNMIFHPFWFFLLCLSRQSVALTNMISTSTNLTKPGCPLYCGNITIPYPFGIGLDCSLDPSFNIFCDDSLKSPKPYLRIGDVRVNYGASQNAVEVIDISNPQLRIKTPMISSRCYDEFGNLTFDMSTSVSIDISSSWFTFSASENKVIAIGCDDDLYLSSPVLSNGCSSRCSTRNDVEEGCSGKGCCQTTIPTGLKVMAPRTSSLKRHVNVSSFNPCGYAFLAQASKFSFGGASDLSDPTFLNRTIDSVSIVLDWQIGNLSCSEAQNTIEYACRYQNSHCLGSGSDVGGYHCVCNGGYFGNPYLSPGCQDIDECADQNNTPCVGTCRNIEGSFICSCPNGYYGDGKKINGTGCIKKTEFPVLKLSLGLGFGAIVLAVILTLAYFSIKKRKLLQLREKFFQQNGGLLLKQRLASSNEGAVESTKIFTIDQLERATNNFASNCILGQGGSGTVYKGILPDKSIVAIKKSKVIDKSQIVQFTNEVIILTQINHRNVVKLLGCCLETEVPLLVYEYVCHGTLYDHIHQSKEESWLSWESRLRIGFEAANAISYLHSAASMPIIHRDIKSTNILLDDFYTAKISDFGASRLVPLDQTRVNTLVQGTLGYLDPEYFQTGNLTEKSDVYSFGVVLAELLTRKKPLLAEEEGSLAKLMIESVKEKCLFKILDHRVLKEGSFEQLQDVAKLVVQCLNLKGEERPAMREVATELERIRRLTKNPWLHQESNEENAPLLSNPVDLYTVTLDDVL